MTRGAAPLGKPSIGDMRLRQQEKKRSMEYEKETLEQQTTKKKRVEPLMVELARGTCTRDSMYKTPFTFVYLRKTMLEAIDRVIEMGFAPSVGTGYRISENAVILMGEIFLADFNRFAPTAVELAARGNASRVNYQDLKTAIKLYKESLDYNNSEEFYYGTVPISNKKKRYNGGKAPAVQMRHLNTKYAANSFTITTLRYLMRSHLFVPKRTVHDQIKDRVSSITVSDGILDVIRQYFFEFACDFMVRACVIASGKDHKTIKTDTMMYVSEFYYKIKFAGHDEWKAIPLYMRR